MHDFLENFHKHMTTWDVEGLRDAFAPDVVTQNPGGTLKSFDEWAGFAAVFATAAPDSQLGVTTTWESGDTLIVEGVFTGTHTGPLQSPEGAVPASGNTFAVPYVDVFELRDGVCVNHRSYWDNAGFLMQLGAMG